MKDPKTSPIAYIAENISIIIGLVLVWRGVWYMLDGIDMLVFKANHIGTAIGGIVLGLIILYIPDKDLKEIQKL